MDELTAKHTIKNFQSSSNLAWAIRQTDSKNRKNATHIAEAEQVLVCTHKDIGSIQASGRDRKRVN